MVTAQGIPSPVTIPCEIYYSGSILKVIFMHMKSLNWAKAGNQGKFHRGDTLVECLRISKNVSGSQATQRGWRRGEA